MRTNLSLLALLVLLTGCTSPETTAYRIIGSTIITVDSAMKGWGDWVRAGKATRGDEVKVKAAYESYQASMSVVEAAVMAYKKNPSEGTALEQALTALEQSKGALIQLIQQLMMRTP
jgi:hypothetical protein